MTTSVSEGTNVVPEPVVRVGELMSSYQGQWVLCGGWAVDAWLGRLTREHGDVDIAVFRDELPVLFRHLDGWDLVAHDSNVAGDTSELWDGRKIDIPGHIHGRRREPGRAMPDRIDPAKDDGFGLDIQICERSGGDWIMSREPLITRPLDACVKQSPWGMPTLMPEAILFYKSGDPRLRDKLDFMGLRSRLSDEQRDWLREAISLTGHPWLSRLPS